MQKRHSQTLKFFHAFKRFRTITYLHIVILSRLLFTRHEHVGYVFSSEFTTKLTRLLVANQVSVFFLTVYCLSPTKLTTSGQINVLHSLRTNDHVSGTSTFVNLKDKLQQADISVASHMLSVTHTSSSSSSSFYHLHLSHHLF
jgi:hypothetical protein